ncbi:MAG: hypothetical protein WD377_06095 [Nitriliruptoraceae bacterium]
MSWQSLLLRVVLVTVGIAAVVLGEADDSPGLQGLGVLLVVGVIWCGFRRVRTSHHGE